MEINDYDKSVELTKSYLDTLDIKAILMDNQGMDVYDVMTWIENWCREDWFVLGHPEVFEGGLFNYMNKDDFMEYVYERYGEDFFFEHTEHNVKIF